MNIQILNPDNAKLLVTKPGGLTDDSGNKFPLIAGAYRFVQGENYTDSFGFQWNKFTKTQLDRSALNSNQSYERFFLVTGWDKEDLTGKNVLEVGSGAGRFTQVVLSKTKANLFSVDYSNAVEANFKNNGQNERLHLFQASIYQLPFTPHQFDKVFCFGVLQHTPDFKASIKCLVEMVKPGGELVVDFYTINGWYTKIHSKYLLRPITRKMSHEKLLSYIERNVDKLISIYRLFERWGVGKLFNRFLPICDITNTLPPNLDSKSLREWVILDTFDMFSPAHDQPQKLSTVQNWFQESGMKEVKGYKVTHHNNQITVVRGIK